MEERHSPSEETLERVRSSISPKELRAQVERISRSDTFDGHLNGQKLLHHLVENAIKRRVQSAREIARDVLGNRHPVKGPVHLRTEMKKLRQKLHEYYTSDAKDEDIWLEIPGRQYDVFWKHSPKTLLGATEFSGWVLWSAKLTAEEAKSSAETSRKFWPHLASVFPVYCAEGFDATLYDGQITLPEIVKMFFSSIGNYHVFITSFDHSTVRIYPLNVWLDQWAKIKSSEDGTNELAVYEFWGRSSEIKNETEIMIHPKLLNALNLRTDQSFRIKLSFHPEGFIYFGVPEPLVRPVGKYNLYSLSYSPTESRKFYFYILVGENKDSAFNDALAGTESFNLKSYGYVIQSGEGDPPDGTKERLLAKYEAVLTRRSLA